MNNVESESESEGYDRLRWIPWKTVSLMFTLTLVFFCMLGLMPVIPLFLRILLSAGVGLLETLYLQELHQIERE